MRSGQTKKHNTILLAVLIALIIAAGAAYVVRLARCETDRRAVAGQVRRQDNGTFVYFDGRCWSRTPPPARDTPF